MIIKYTKSRTSKIRKNLNGGELPSLNTCFHAHIGKHFLGLKNILNKSTTNIQNLTNKANTSIKNSFHKIQTLGQPNLIQQELDRVKTTSHNLASKLNESSKDLASKLNESTNKLSNTVRSVGGKKNRRKKRRTKKNRR